MSLINSLLIRNEYILEQIIENFSQKKLLEIIRYNKKLQSRLNKDINIYKEYTRIEIEVTPMENRYGIFINFPKEDDKYFHIFLMMIILK